MPIDAMILDPMLGPYENMLTDLENQGLENEHVDEVRRLLAKMKALGQEYSDITTFTGICMQENLYGAISDQYSRALQAKASNGQSAATYDDSALLLQSISALEQAIQQLRKSKQEALVEASKDPFADIQKESEFAANFAKQQGLNLSADKLADETRKDREEQLRSKPNAFDNSVEVDVLTNTEDLIAPIQELIDLGKQEGMTLPRFLKLQIERGLDKAMEGAVASRKGIVYSLGWAKASMLSPYHVEKAESELKIFDELSAKQPFNVPNWKELQWSVNDLDYQLDGKIAKWENITDRWNQIFSDLDTWACAHCSFAPGIDPWRLLPEPNKRPAIESSKATLPGIIEQRLRLLEKYHGLTFHDIFAHPTFLWAVEHHYMGFSKEYMEFLRNEVKPVCVPHQSLPQELTSKTEAMFQEKRMGNPRSHWPAIRVQEFYGSQFGADRYVSKFGEIEPSDSNAAPW